MAGEVVEIVGKLVEDAAEERDRLARVRDIKYGGPGCKTPYLLSLSQANRLSDTASHSIGIVPHYDGT